MARKSAPPAPAARPAGRTRAKAPAGAAAAASPGKAVRRLSTLHLALVVSAAVHAAIGLVRFVDPQAFDRVFRDEPLEVILVNARADAPPEKAQAIAQANLQGGGEAQSGRATSPLPPALTTQLGETVEEARARVAQLQKEQQQLLAQVRREIATLPAPQSGREGSREQIEQEERRRQLLRLLAEIERRVNEENARPKKRYISPATREEVYALYYDALRRRIEDRGTRNFPEYRGRKLYGELVMNVTVDAAGRVVDTEIVRPSGQRVLDLQAVAIVNAAAPFGPFSPAMRTQADQIVVTSRFRFTREDELQTTLGGR